MTKLSASKIHAFRRRVLAYYRAHKRDFPWRKTKNPYRILISEFMLQQTQVSRVMQMYRPFLKKFPHVQALAKAPVRDVLKEWQGLGYNRRALNLKRLAEIVVKDYGGKLPQDFEELKKLPGVGQSTAGAVMTFAFNKPSIFIETNIRRVFIHFFFPRKKNIRDEDILAVLKKVNNSSRSRRVVNKKHGSMSWREWYWALFDYGAILGRRTRTPLETAAQKRLRLPKDNLPLTRLTENPNRRSAHYKKQSKFEGSRRQLRGEILRSLFINPGTKEELLILSKRTSEEISDVLQDLKKEKVIKVSHNIFSIA